MNEIEIAPPSVVWQATSDFANALAETAQFKAFEQAKDCLHHDDHAQQAFSAYQIKWRSLEALIRLNALGMDDQKELENLRRAYLAEPSITDYFQAQSNLAELCREAADKLSQASGLNFVTACVPSCCG